MATRNFEYIGEPQLTRGNYGVNISGGHTTDEDPNGIYIFDPDFGEMLIEGNIAAALASGDWREIK